MTAAHTFGPWSASAPAKPTPDAPTGGDIAILDAAGNIIAECFVWVNEAQTVDVASHARLIVGAPDLLDAVRAILFQVVQGKVLERDACIAQARAAYAKAIGGSL